MPVNRKLFTLLLFVFAGVVVFKLTGPLGFFDQKSPQDIWLRALLVQNEKTKVTLKNEKSVEDFIIESYQNTLARPNSDWSRFFVRYLSGHFEGALKESSDYLALADGLFRARDRIRLLKPITQTRAALFLFASLTDETLYAMTVRFPQEAYKKTQWRIDFESSPPECAVGKYFGISLCPGDVVLSKSEAFSSSLFAFRSPDSGTFSHASTPYFTAGMLNPLLIEAEPAGGLFEDPTKEGQLPKIGVYRLSQATDEQRLKIDNAVNEIVRLRSTKLSFNFQLDPKCEPGRYFCTEIVYCAYRQSGLAPELNPYNESLWSSPSPLAKELIEQISSANKGPIPMPGDVELNSAFKPVSFEIKLDQIPTMRIHSAIVAAFVKLMHEDIDLRGRYLQALGKFGEKKLGDLKEGTSLRFLDQLGLPTHNKLAMLRAQLPPETRLKEIAFYFHFQNQMLAKITALLLSHQGPLSFGELESLATPELRSGTESFISSLSSLQSL
jgi:hypothetical protein